MNDEWHVGLRKPETEKIISGWRGQGDFMGKMILEMNSEALDRE